MLYALRMSPANFAGSMANGAGSGTSNPLQLIGWNHHHRSDGVPPCSTEVGRQIRRELKVVLIRQSVGAFKYDMTSRTFLGMEPKVAAASLTQADPVVLSMIASHLNQDATGACELQWLGLVLFLSTFRLGMLPWREEVVEFPLKFL